MPKILVIHGPNLNLLGSREIDVYGNITIDDINKKIKELSKSEGIETDIRQSNHEGEIVDLIQNARGRFDAILINPAAYTHTSVAIRDAVSAAGVPTVEAHLTNIYAREKFRHTSVIAPVAAGQVCGFGPESYVLGFKACVSIIKKGTG